MNQSSISTPNILTSPGTLITYFKISHSIRGGFAPSGTNLDSGWGGKALDGFFLIFIQEKPIKSQLGHLKNSSLKLIFFCKKIPLNIGFQGFFSKGANIGFVSNKGSFFLLERALLKPVKPAKGL